MATIMVVGLVLLVIIYSNLAKFENGQATAIEPRDRDRTNKLEGFELRKFLRSTNLKVHDGNDNCTSWKVLSVRFPTRGENKNYRSGISCYCDWVFTSSSFFGNVSKTPKIIFVVKDFLPLFWKFSRSIDSPFVLISAGGDITIPNNTDVRYQPYRNFGARSIAWDAILRNSNLIHWFIENHDVSHSKVSTLPCGVVDHGPGSRNKHDLEMSMLLNEFKSSRIPGPANKSIQVLSADRFRSGQGQWTDRGNVYFACKSSTFCTTGVKNITFVPNSTRIMETELSKDEFIRLVVSSKFVAMVHGGGLDPSPKAWEVMALGAIPILQRSPLENGYKKLPVVFVDSLLDFLHPNNESQSRKLMEEWECEWGPFFVHGSALRNATLHRLTTAFWWDQVVEKYKEFEAGALWRR